jgi:transposase
MRGVTALNESERIPMRCKSVLRRLLDVRGLVVGKTQMQEGNLEIEVRPRWKTPRCAQCGAPAPGYDRRPQRRWRHLAFGPCAVTLRFAPRRVQCERCGIGGEALPWAADPRARFTRALEETAAYFATIMDKTAVTRLLGISWRAVDAIVERVVERRLDASRFAGVRILGVDEFSYRKRHHYVTIVVDHERRRVLWAAPGRSSETLAKFFEALGPRGRAQIQAVTLNMSGGYLKAIREAVPHANIVFDRFHVQQLASQAVDEVRRAMMRAVEDPQARRALKHTRFALLTNPWNLRSDQRAKLADVQRHNAPLYRAYLLKETLAEALSSLRPAHARRKLSEWLAWASRSRLRPFVRLARTLRRHQGGILAYIDLRLTNGLSERINNRIRMIAHRAFGYHSAQALIAMIFLACGQIPLYPTLPKPT